MPGTHRVPYEWTAKPDVAGDLFKGGRNVGTEAASANEIQPSDPAQEQR